ncbi:hypothetical protein [Nitrobacter winogradskyi]|uniref:Uncharacterized protein n=2 Tax=Nitrobacter winogradskyi TaxID=913 RepID=A0ACC6AF18_NITWI|nr:hypothetical protein [Nitrobacter winogradskyi]MCP1997876.1 hypothetical protein [Nitrobacter winogradskyi]GEC17543.1 hypothetical protein NWI01_34350 [Nitrobacter winogradskyi]
MTIFSDNGLMNDPSYPGWRLFKIFHPHRLVLCFGPDGFEYFIDADFIDRTKGQYTTNNSQKIRKCDALDFNEGQREPWKEIPTFQNALPYLSINGETLFCIIHQHMRTAPDRSFEAKDLSMFFERYTNSLNEAEKTFEKFAVTLAKLNPEKVRLSP